MAANTGIEWTEKTWNPVVGCTKISPGCKHCYAEKMHKRLMGMGSKKYQQPFSEVRFFEETLNEPAKWKKPAMIFVNSMSDLFHPDVKTDDIRKVISTIKNNPQHTFQILTKRVERMKNFFEFFELPPRNLWLGVSVEDVAAKERINYLRPLNCSVKFLSIEPLLEDIGELNLERIDWVIVGGESGPKARPMQKEWVENIKEQCTWPFQDVPFFFKQWGGLHSKKNGCKLNGKEYKEYPRYRIA